MARSDDNTPQRPKGQSPKSLSGLLPFLRPYRKTRDLSTWSEERQSWYKDPQTVKFLEQELKRGIFHGIVNFMSMGMRWILR